jgi:hypothetical protein
METNVGNDHVSDGFLVKKAITLNGLGINEIMAQSE